MKLKAILFDLDGVILDSEKIYQRFWIQAAAELGYHISDEVFLQLRSCDASIARRIVEEAANAPGANKADVCNDSTGAPTAQKTGVCNDSTGAPSDNKADIHNDSIGAPTAYDLIRAHRKKMMSEYMRSHGLELKDGVAEFLSELRQYPVKKAIVTSLSLEEKLPLLEKLGIAECFDEIVSVKEAARGKPFPDLYLSACGKMGLAPGECLAIEDSPNGVRSAHAAGVKVVMVPDLSGPDAELAKICVVADRIGDVLELIKTELS